MAKLKLIEGGAVRQKKRRKNVRMNDESREAFRAIIERVCGTECEVFEDMLYIYLQHLKDHGVHVPLARRLQCRIAVHWIARG